MVVFFLLFFGCNSYIRKVTSKVGRNVPSSWCMIRTFQTSLWSASVGKYPSLSIGWLKKKKKQPSNKGLLTKCENSSDLSVENVISTQIYHSEELCCRLAVFTKRLSTPCYLCAHLSAYLRSVFEPSAPFLWSLFAILISAECLLTK